jgi:hypothetical protein
MRFALYEAKMGLITLLSKYRLHPTENTPRTITYDPKAILSTSMYPLWAKIEKR